MPDPTVGSARDHALATLLLNPHDLREVRIGPHGPQIEPPACGVGKQGSATEPERQRWPPSIAQVKRRNEGRGEPCQGTIHAEQGAIPSLLISVTPGHALSQKLRGHHAFGRDADEQQAHKIDPGSGPLIAAGSNKENRRHDKHAYRRPQQPAQPDSAFFIWVH